MDHPKAILLIPFPVCTSCNTSLLIGSSLYWSFFVQWRPSIHQWQAQAKLNGDKPQAQHTLFLPSVNNRRPQNKPLAQAFVYKYPSFLPFQIKTFH
jgi:hypothetical protein